MKNLCDSVLCEFRTSGKSTVCAFWDSHRELGWLRQGGHQLGLAGWQVPDNGGRGQRTLWAGGLEERGRGSAAAHWARAICWRPGRRTRRHIVLGYQGYSGKYKHLAQPGPAGRCLLCKRRVALQSQNLGVSLGHSPFD